jgi:uncharacterized protein (DUF983 family)
MTTLAVLAGYSLTQLAIAAIIIAGICAVVWIGMRAMGVSPPAWFVQIVWVIVVVVVCVFAIKFLSSMG